MTVLIVLISQIIFYVDYNKSYLNIIINNNIYYYYNYN